MVVMPGGRGHGQGGWICTCQESIYVLKKSHAGHTFLHLFYSIHIIRQAVSILVPDSLAKS
jgi:hypothetical protein